MVHIRKYWKNSNTGELLSSTEHTETKIIGFPVYYYDIEGKSYGENLELVGFVEISEKKFLKAKKSKKSKKSYYRTKI